MEWKYKRKIKNILKDNCIAIHHIGGKAVAGLKAKAVIDMMPVVADITKKNLPMTIHMILLHTVLGKKGL